ncbi:hypothetical protein K445DRAFT_126877 [Daldinia sp. EC12]|nr:hypothetical protein K445DRAFT_126877 [Daldinia sp. EC12]
MLGLINLNRGRDRADGNAIFTWGGRQYTTDATSLIPTPAGVDPALSTLVCACMAEMPNHRPSLNTLVRAALRGVRERGPEIFDDPQMEHNRYVSHIWRRIVNDAPTDDDEEMTDDWTTTAPSVTEGPSSRRTSVASVPTPSRAPVTPSSRHPTPSTRGGNSTGTITPSARGGGGSGSSTGTITPSGRGRGSIGTPSTRGSRGSVGTPSARGSRGSVGTPSTRGSRGSVGPRTPSVRGSHGHGGGGSGSGSSSRTITPGGQGGNATTPRGKITTPATPKTPTPTPTPKSVDSAGIRWE